VRPGAGVAAVSRQLTDAGLLAEPYSLRLLARATDRAAAMQAGTYRLDRPLTPLELLDKLARGDVLLAEVRFIEGTTLRQWLRAARAGDEAAPRARRATRPACARPWAWASRAPRAGSFPTPTASPRRRRRGASSSARTRDEAPLEAAWAAREPALPLRTPTRPDPRLDRGEGDGRAASARSSPRCS
jgi:UPF0755 protein